MNFSLALSNTVEQRVQAMQRPETWTSTPSIVGLRKPWLRNPRHRQMENIRIGGYILLIDSNTEVPEDSLLDAAREMDQSPKVSIIQFSSAVMQVSHNFFENGITFFTNLI